MKIVLVRHAKVSLDESKKVRAKQLKAWVDRYDFSPIDRQSKPSLMCQKLLREASFIVASKRQRTTDSLGLIELEADVTDALFNEVEVANASFPFLKMQAKSHLMASRVLMLFPFGKPYQFLVAEKQRAKKASEQLELFAQEHNDVALMGHGAMNYLIAKVLKKSQWKLIQKGGGRGNWSYSVWVKHEVEELS